MEQFYSIKEILTAVDDLQNKKKIKNDKVDVIKINNSDIPKNTIHLIEEAEKIKK